MSVGRLQHLRSYFKEGQKGDFQKFQQQLQSSEVSKGDLDLLLRRVVETKQSDFQSYCNILVKKGANINFCDSKDNISNLMVACEKGNIDMVQSIVKYKDINILHVNRLQANAAFYAIDNKSKEDSEAILKILLQKEPTLVNKEAGNETLLTRAVLKGKLQIVKILLENGADPNHQIADTGNSALHVVVLKNKSTKIAAEIFKMLLMKGADTSIQNKQYKTIYDYPEKSAQYQKIEEQIKEQMRERKNKENLQKCQEKKFQKQDIKKQPHTLLTANNNQQINKIKKDGDEIYKKYCKQLKRDIKNQSQDSEDEQSNENSVDSNQMSEIEKLLREQNAIKELGDQIERFQTQKDKQYNQARIEISYFIIKLENILSQQQIKVQTYGSFATGLWLKHCDIDLLLIPPESIYDLTPNRTKQYLDRVYELIKKSNIYKSIVINRNVRVPLIRLEIVSDSGKIRKIDITILDRNHNGRAITIFILDQLKNYPKIHPIFFVIKNLSCGYKLNDPKNGGIRTYAIVIMLISCLSKWKDSSLGKLLLDFLYYFGFYYQYNYLINDANSLLQEQEIMVLHILDPLNHANNIGKNSRADEIQKMFRSAYIALYGSLHTPRRLQLMFETRYIMLS